MDNFTVDHSTTNGLINPSTSGCSIIKITLKNELYQLRTWYNHGNYNVAETLVNGKSHWIDPTYDAAIWYVSNGNYWTIGSYLPLSFNPGHIPKGQFFSKANFLDLI